MDITQIKAAKIEQLIQVAESCRDAVALLTREEASKYREAQRIVDEMEINIRGRASLVTSRLREVVRDSDYDGAFLAAYGCDEEELLDNIHYFMSEVAYDLGDDTDGNRFWTPSTC